MDKWLLLVYRIPREPSAGRVAVWRKLKQLGAVWLQDAAWVLPKRLRTREHFQWLAAEITQLGGHAILWEAEQLYATDTQALKKEFSDAVDVQYRAILDELREKGCDLTMLSARFKAAQAIDYFSSPLGEKARQRLLSHRKGSKQ